MAELTQRQPPFERVFGKEASSNKGKSPPNGDAGTSPLCPQCHSKRLYRDGFRYLANGSSVQRWLCRDCGFRFSDPEDVKQSMSNAQKITQNSKQSIRTQNSIPLSRQICVSETKNLVAATETKRVVRSRRAAIALTDAINQLKVKLGRWSLFSKAGLKRKAMLRRVITPII